MRDLPPTSRNVGVVPDDPRSDGWELVGREYAAAIQIYARSRWLDPALRLDGRFHPAQEMLREKIAWLDRFLANKAR